MLTGRRRAQWESIVWLSPHLKEGTYPSDANPYRKKNAPRRGGGPRMTAAELDAWATELTKAKANQ